MASENPTKAPLFETVGAQVAETAKDAGDDEPKVVDEIESLCMNCHADVCIPIEPTCSVANIESNRA
jgi:zinc finger protein